MPRIVSLIASATEIVCALGFEKDLVARSHECDFPKSIEHLPHCTEPRFNIVGTSAQIDERVKSILRQSLSVYLVDAEKLRQLRPDLIVTQTHCEVCAVSEKDVEQALCNWIESRPRIISLVPNCLADLWSDIRQVAEALHVSEPGSVLIDRLQRRLADIAARAAGLPDRPTIACIEWIEPLMSAGNWMPELIEMAGGVSQFGEAGKHSPRMSWQELCAKDPDVILVMACGWDIAKSREEIVTLTSKPEWPTLNAVRNRRVYVADGNQYFNRPGPRLVETLEILAEILHPGRFAFSHEGSGWQHL